MICYPYVPGKIVVSGANGRNGFATVCELSALKRIRHLVGLFRKPEEKEKLEALWQAHEERERSHIHITPVWTNNPDDAKEAQVWINFRGMNLATLEKKIPDLKMVALQKGVHQRDLLLEENIKISSADAEMALKYSPGCIYIQQGNPVDILVRNCVALGFSASKVISTGVMLESNRFINIFNRRFPGVAFENASSLFIGEHGEMAVPVKSRISFNGILPGELLRSYGVHNPENEIERIYKEVNTEAFELRQLTGETPWEGPAAVTTELVDKLLNPQRDSLVSACVYVAKNKHYELDDVAISIPVAIGEKGLMSIVEIVLSQDEKRKFREAVNHVKNTANRL